MADIDERFAEALHATARAWRQAVDRRLRRLGMSQASWLAIAVTAKARGALSQSELADRLGVEGASVVAMADRLVKAGLIRREPSRTDRRVKRIVLTEAGYRVYETVRGEADAVRAQLLQSIDRDALRAATQVLTQLQTIIDAGL
ncbi:MAG: MarR family transcriptional regulator [Pseudomonadota bacterium]|nr:MarR family transcriptional regulator [Pseudomonadota bacterium]